MAVVLFVILVGVTVFQHLYFRRRSAMTSSGMAFRGAGLHRPGARRADYAGAVHARLADLIHVRAPVRDACDRWPGRGQRRSLTTPI